MRKITLECEYDGERVDVFLAVNLPDITRSAAQKLLEAGYVTLDGVPVRKNHRTSQGETYIIIQNEPDDSVMSRQDIPLDIVFEDDDLIVVNKPKGMVIHPAPGHPDGTLVNALLYHCGDSLSGIGGVIRPGIVHRIDKDTSGLVIAAKNDRAHLSLASQLSSRTLTREYETIVCGKVKNDIGIVDAPIGRHPIDRKRQSVHASQDTAPQNTAPQNTTPRVVQGTAPRTFQGTAKRIVQGIVPRDRNSRSAVTHYEVIARYTGYTHVRCSLETGRTHQIRVHLAYIGHPILGDMVYGRKKPELGMSSQCLHARRLCFKHPTTEELVELSTDLPDYFIEVLTKLEKRT